MIGAIQNGYYNSALLAQIGQQSALQPAAINVGASGAISQANGVAQGGTFASAIKQALTTLGTGTPSGIAATSAAAGSASAQSPQQALNAFMQNLFASLQSQNGHTSQAAQLAVGASSAVSGVTGMAGVSAATGHGHHFHHGGGMEGKLQSLIQQLSSSATSAPAGSSGSSNSADAALQQSYQGLLSAQGATGNPASLTGFLQLLAQNLQGASSSGNAVNMQV